MKTRGLTRPGSSWTAPELVSVSRLQLTCFLSLATIPGDTAEDKP